MKKHGKQKSRKYYYPLRRENDLNSVDLIPITEEQYWELSRCIDRKRKQEQRAGRCRCPKSYFWKCDADCDNCQYHRNDFLSLDQEMNDDEENGSCLLDYLADDTCLVETVERRALFEALELILDGFPEEEQEIIRLLSEGYSERKMAQIMGCSQKTINNKKRLILARLMEQLKDWK
ncbi:MAG: hypothetical protein ACOX2M_06035 [Fastidiosipilaceae bacterium]|jgi:DNA-directed RNA polymerase specialized sigma24 family protein